MSSFEQVVKQLIRSAVIKVSVENPALNREGEPSAEEARDMFIESLLAELFPEHGNEKSVSVEVPVVQPIPVESPVKKKQTKEEKAAAKAAKAASPEDKAAAKAAKEAEKEAAKAAKEAEKAAAKAAKEAEKAAAKAAKAEAKKSSPKKAADTALPTSPKAERNVPKIDPTWRKLLKEADKEHAKELEPELLKYLNGIANAIFHDRPARQHVADFIANRAPAVAEKPMGPIDLEVVEFNGVEYYVNLETKRVYEGVTNAEGELTITRPVGYVGMADFKDMKLDE